MRSNRSYEPRLIVAVGVLLGFALSGCTDPSFVVKAQNSTSTSANVTVSIQDSDGVEKFNETREALPGTTTYLTDGELKWDPGDYTVTAWVDGQRISDSRYFSDSLSSVNIRIGENGSRIIFVI